MVLYSRYYYAFCVLYIVHVNLLVSPIATSPPSFSLQLHAQGVLEDEANITRRGAASASCRQATSGALSARRLDASVPALLGDVDGCTLLQFHGVKRETGASRLAMSNDRIAPALGGRARQTTTDAQLGDGFIVGADSPRNHRCE